MMRSTASMAEKLGLRRSGTRFVGACPSCGYANSFVLQDGDQQPLIFCHACQDVDAVLLLLRQRGVWGSHNHVRTECRKPASGKPGNSGLFARELWFRASPSVGTLVET